MAESRLAGRVAIVTGAGQGIGRAFARSLAAAGAIPVIAELNAGHARAVTAEIESTGAKALAVATDIPTQETSFPRLPLLCFQDGSRHRCP